MYKYLHEWYTPFKKWILKPCNHPEHNPPNMMVYKSPYKHMCPACGMIQIVYPENLKWKE